MCAMMATSSLRLPSTLAAGLLRTPAMRLPAPPRCSSISAVAASAGGVSSAVGLSHAFCQLKKQGTVALIPYITAGDPDLSTTAEALKVLGNCGADMIEIGVPYSDHLADGPVIQAAAARALAKVVNFDSILSMLKGVFPQLSCPIALFCYYNPILKCGVGRFMPSIKDVGVHELILPEVPLEEAEILRKEAKNNGIELILLTTPTNPPEKMKAIVEATEGFLYLVSSVAVTGARASLSDKVPNLLQETKKVTDKPVAVGFGISKPEQVRWERELMAVIVGSAMVKLLGESDSSEEGLKNLAAFTKSLKSVLP